jgi:RHS repeat-associated protein
MKYSRRLILIAYALVIILGKQSVFADGCNFTGESIDQQIGIESFRSRFYDPETGTFLVKDPLGIHAGANTYVYAQDNPVNNVDPTGQATVGLGVGASFSFYFTQYQFSSNY